MNKLTAKDLQDIGLAEHAEAYIKQEQHNQNNSSSSVNTKSGLENRESKRRKIREAKREHAN